MQTVKKVSLDTKPVNSFEQFAKAFYVFAKFREMEVPLWKAILECMELKDNPEKLEEWCEQTNYYGDNNDN
jgi:hypothetical protein